MGNSVCRLVLSREVPGSAVTDFARLLRSKVLRPTSLYLRDLSGRHIRDARLVAARDASVRIIDVEPITSVPLLQEAAELTLGQGRFVIRVADDEETDITVPNESAITNIFPGARLSWLLAPDERPIPWNVETYYLFPGNASNWSLQVPIMASLMHISTPSQTRSCPMCRTLYSSKGERGQCPACGFVATPFRTRHDAMTISPTPLDAFGWGRCSRCSGTREFTHQVEQCFHCGQLLEGAPGRHKNVALKPNKAEIIALVASLDSE